MNYQLLCSLCDVNDYCVDRMSECGEDLLVDLSEILFNELAFFRLMQDLDESKAKVRAKLKSFERVL